MKKKQNDLESDIKSIATSIANVFYRSYKNYLNYDDLLHEAYEAVIAAKNTFDETRGTSFEPYLKACVRNKLINYVKKKIKTREMEVILPDDNNDGVFRKEVTLEDMENSILVKDIEHFMMTHQDLFSNDDLTIFNMRAMGSSYKEIAEKINKNTKYVDNSLRRIKKIISERFGI